MKFRADTYERDVDALLAEFVDDETIRDFGGDPQFAYEAVAALLGVRGSDAIPLVGDWVVTPEHPDEIDRRVAIAREGRARGESIAALADAGKFDRG